MSECLAGQEQSHWKNVPEIPRMKREQLGFDLFLAQTIESVLGEDLCIGGYDAFFFSKSSFMSNNDLRTIIVNAEHTRGTDIAHSNPC